MDVATQVKRQKDQFAAALDERDAEFRALVEQVDNLTAENARLRESIADRAAELAGLDLGTAELPYLNQYTQGPAESRGLPLEECESLARRVSIHAFRGSESVAIASVRDAFRGMREERGLLCGQDLVDAPLAKAARLQTRLLNTLEGAGILTAGHLLALEDDLPRIRIANLGEKQVEILQGACTMLKRRAGRAVLPLAPKVPLSDLARRTEQLKRQDVRTSQANGHKPRREWKYPTNDAAFAGGQEGALLVDSDQEAARAAAERKDFSRNLEDLAADFNRKHPIGGRLKYWPVLGGDDWQAVRLAGKAFVEGHDAKARVEFAGQVRRVVSIDQLG